MSPFNWRGKPSMFASDARFTWAAQKDAATAKKRGTDLLPIASNTTINTEQADRANRPRQKARALA